MSTAVLLFLLTSALLVAGVAVREREVPAGGTVGRRPVAHVIGGLLVAAVVVTATLTFVRLVTMAA